MSKAASKPKKRMWTVIKDVEKGTVGIYRYDIPHYVTSIAEWSYMISHPTIIGEPDADESTVIENPDPDFLHGLA